MKQYLTLLNDIMEHGEYAPPAREGMPGTKKLFGYQLRNDLRKGFPLLTTKKIFWKGVVVELLWFLRGDSNIKHLINNRVHIWDRDAYSYFLKKIKHSRLEGQYTDTEEDFIRWIDFVKDHAGEECAIIAPYKWGDTGKQYPWLWRKWETFESDGDGDDIEIFNKSEPVDQIKNLINSLQNTPESRRHILTAWNPATLNDMALNACHVLVQFNCQKLSGNDKIKEMLRRNPDATEVVGVPDYYLDCQLYQRSADSFLGVPFNIASYALLTHILAKICNMIPRYFIHTFGDVHIYENHFEQVKEQLSREPKELPTLFINQSVISQWNEQGNIIVDDNITYHDFQIKNYNPYPSIKAELSTGLKK